MKIVDLVIKSMFLCPNVNNELLTLFALEGICCNQTAQGNPSGGALLRSVFKVGLNAINVQED